MNLIDELGMVDAPTDFHVVQMAIDILRPQYEAWLTARPPCPTCGGTRSLGAGTRHDKYESDWSGCPDCPDGIQPFGKWTAGLVVDNQRLREQIDCVVRVVMSSDERERWMARYGQIGGTR